MCISPTCSTAIVAAVSTTVAVTGTARIIVAGSNPGKIYLHLHIAVIVAMACFCVDPSTVILTILLHVAASRTILSLITIVVYLLRSALNLIVLDTTEPLPVLGVPCLLALVLNCITLGFVALLLITVSNTSAAVLQPQITVGKLINIKLRDLLMLSCRTFGAIVAVWGVRPGKKFVALLLELRSPPLSRFQRK